MKKKWFGVVLWCTFFLLTLTVVVNSSAEVSSDELLQILKDKGVVTDQDVEKAKKPGKEKERTLLEAYRNTKSFGIAGRVQVRYMRMENDKNHSRAVYQKDFDRPEFDGFCIRRVRLRWQGNITDKWAYHTQISVDGAENEDAKVDPEDPDYAMKKSDIGLKLQDAEIRYRIHPYLNINMGQFKTRFTTAYLTRGPNLPLCERALIIDKIAPPTRDIGITIESEKGKYSFDGREHGRPIYNKPIYYAASIYNGNGFNKMRNDNEDYMYMGMLLVRPCKHFNFGGSYAYTKLGYNYDTTTELGDATVDSNGNYVFEVDQRARAEDIEWWDCNAALDVGPVHVQFEYIRRDTELKGNTADASGYGIQGQIDLLDNFQLTGRYDELDDDDKTNNLHDSQWYTVGFNWFIYGQKVKWQVNYTFREETYKDKVRQINNVDNDTLITHFQLLF